MVGGGAPGDEFYANTVLLLNFQGADGATTAVDSSFQQNGAATFHNQAQLDTSQSPFGGSSLLLDGTDKIVWADNADWHVGSGDWTKEIIVRLSTTSGFQTLFAQADTSGNGPFMLDVVNGSILRLRYQLNGDGMVNNQATWNYVTDTWYHLCAERSSGVVRTYAGTIGGDTAAMITKQAGLVNSAADGALDLTLGAMTQADSSTTNGLSGWLGGVRFTNGVARYNSDAGFATASAPFPEG